MHVNEAIGLEWRWKVTWFVAYQETDPVIFFIIGRVNVMKNLRIRRGVHAGIVNSWRGVVY